MDVTSRLRDAMLAVAPPAATEADDWDDDMVDHRVLVGQANLFCVGCQVLYIYIYM